MSLKFSSEKTSSLVVQICENTKNVSTQLAWLITFENLVLNGRDLISASNKCNADRTNIGFAGFAGLFSEAKFLGEKNLKFMVRGLTKVLISKLEV